MDTDASRRQHFLHNNFLQLLFAWPVAQVEQSTFVAIGCLVVVDVVEGVPRRSESRVKPQSVTSDVSRGTAKLPRGEQNLYPRLGSRSEDVVPPGGILGQTFL